MTKLREALYIILAIIIIVVGGFYIFRHSKPKMPPLKDEVVLEVIRDIIVNAHNCNVALPKLGELLKKSPTYADAWHWQGVCQFQAGDLVSAKASFTKAVSLDSTLIAPQRYLDAIQKYETAQKKFVKK